MRKILENSALLMLIVLLVGACANTSPRYGDRGYSDSGYQSSDPRYRDSRHASRCDSCGTVERIETAWERDRASGGGAVLGAIIGGVVGSNIGSGSGRDLATVGGAVAGGVAGHQIESRRQGEQQVYVFQVRLDDGRWAQVGQRHNPGLREGDRVVIRNQELHPLR